MQVSRLDRGEVYLNIKINLEQIWSSGTSKRNAMEFDVEIFAICLRRSLRFAGLLYKGHASMKNVFTFTQKSLTNQHVSLRTGKMVFIHYYDLGLIWVQWNCWSDAALGRHVGHLLRSREDRKHRKGPKRWRWRTGRTWLLRRLWARLRRLRLRLQASLLRRLWRIWWIWPVRIRSLSDWPKQRRIIRPLIDPTPPTETNPEYHLIIVMACGAHLESLALHNTHFDGIWSNLFHLSLV